MTVDTGKDELMDTGKFKAEVLARLNQAIAEIEDIKRMKEEERDEKAGIKAAIRRVWRAVVAAAKDLEQ